MTFVNSADLRNQLATILSTVVKKKTPVVIGRFGEPKAVLVDLTTFTLQQTILRLISKLDRLSSREIETLELLIDPKTREAFLQGLDEINRGEVVRLADL